MSLTRLADPDTGALIFHKKIDPDADPTAKNRARPPGAFSAEDSSAMGPEPASAAECDFVEREKREASSSLMVVKAKLDMSVAEVVKVMLLYLPKEKVEDLHSSIGG